MSGHIIGVEPLGLVEFAEKEASRIVGRPVKAGLKTVLGSFVLSLWIETDAGRKMWISPFKEVTWPEDDQKAFTRKILIPACHKLMQSEVVA